MNFDDIKKKDLKILDTYYKKNKTDFSVGKALIFAQLKFNLHFDAYKTLILMYEENKRALNEICIESILSEI